MKCFRVILTACLIVMSLSLSGCSNKNPCEKDCDVCADTASCHCHGRCGADKCGCHGGH